MGKKEEERLYFIIRSILLSWVAGAQFLILVIIFEYVDIFRAVFFGIIVFITSLAISRAFEKFIDKAVNKAVKILRKYPRIKKFILKYF